MAAKSHSPRLSATQNLIRCLGWAAASLSSAIPALVGSSAHTSPERYPGNLDFQSGWAYDGGAVVVPQQALRRMRRSGTRALRFVASACIPTVSFRGSASTFQRGCSTPTTPETGIAGNPESATTFCRVGIQQHSQTLHRQAKQNSQNLLNIATGGAGRQPLEETLAAGVPVAAMNY